MRNMDEQPSEPQRINYLYFGALFVLLLITTSSSILIKENLAGSRMFFWFYALGQSVLEVALFVFLALLITRYIGKLGFRIFVGFTFIIFLMHLLDFVMDRVLDLSAWDAVFAFLVGESLDQFLLLLDATGVSLWIWIIVFSLVAAVPIFGLIFYHGTDWIANKRPLTVKNEIFLQLFVCIPAALFYWDFSASNVIQPDAYNDFVKSLPWKRTFLQPEKISMHIPGKLKIPEHETEVVQAVANIEAKLTRKPNIFLFVVETLRADFMTPEAAPNLSAFKNQNVSAHVAFANANWTSMSWFSIFHSQPALFWLHRQKQNWTSGSPALQVFKKLGYKIHVYSSAQLAFYGLEEMMFGDKQQLLDTYQTFHHPPPKEAWASDRALMQKLEADLSANPSMSEGQLIIIFWDATHFDYSWPRAEPPKFIPFAKEFAFFKTYPTKKNISRIKNRYRNSVYYMDQLFGEFVKKADPNALIAFTADHGEEFFDHGHLFHGSHLSPEQIQVPIYFRLGSLKKQVPILSQIDIFPTLLDAVAGQTFSFLDGESILRPKTRHFALTTRFNARKTPYEFSLHNLEHKVVAQFNTKSHIFDSTGLRILSLMNCRTGVRLECEGNIGDWIEGEFGPALNHLYRD